MIDRTGIQLYSLRELGELDRQLEVAAAAGYGSVELIGGQLADARATRQRLDAHGLRAPTAHVGMVELRQRLNLVAERAGEAGVRQLFMPAVPPDERDGPPESWRQHGEELAGMAETLAVLGLGLGYHNHAWELRSYPDGTRPLDHLFDGARGSKLTWQADIGWLARAQVDPLVWLERYRNRLIALHIKDIAPPDQNLDEDGWADVGKGSIPWPQLLPEAQRLGAVWLVVEHDRPSDPARFAHDSLAYLRDLPDRSWVP